MNINAISGIPHDLQVTIAIATGIVIFLLQCVNLWRSLVNGRGIKGTRADITGLSVVSADISKQMHVARQALAKVEAAHARIETLVATAQPYRGGRRESDRPPATAPEAPATTPPPYEGPARREADERRLPPRDAGPPRSGIPSGIRPIGP